MSHHHRTEKNCLNCGAEVLGKFCQQCGQENLEPKETAIHMVRHFAEDVTHFDSKFFNSVKYLFTRPGFLATEYMKGRRVSYLNPVRMYLFTSALIFILISYLSGGPEHISPTAAYTRDTIEQNSNSSTVSWYTTDVPGTDEQVSGLEFPRIYATNGVHAYDSIQRSLPETEKDDFFAGYFNRKLAATATTYHKNPNEFMRKLNQRFLNSFSKVFFFSLPLFVLFLSVLYVRRKQFYFSVHAVFTLQYYCFVFFSLLLITIAQIYAFDDGPASSAMMVVLFAVFAGIYVYLYLAMLHFYGQSWFKTAVKFMVLSAAISGALIMITGIIFFNLMVSLAEA
ncbi:MAG: DUF3667 domain-containing protein [Chitinophagaceae bacterium]|nr:DUF3667 domain-containing protein [Chitinophagaceae bacterium]